VLLAVTRVWVNPRLNADAQLGLRNGSLSVQLPAEVLGQDSSNMTRLRWEIPHERIVAVPRMGASTGLAQRRVDVALFSSLID